MSGVVLTAGRDAKAQTPGCSGNRCPYLGEGECVFVPCLFFSDTCGSSWELALFYTHLSHGC